jgi:AcrR family transcriptional regulator
MPRRYDLGKRADLRAETRRRIVEAATEFYREDGRPASTAEIAKRADVAVGTVRNHFPTPDALPRAIADHVLAELRMPRVEAIDAFAPTRARIGTLAREVGEFYLRSETWYRLTLAEQGSDGAWAKAEADYAEAFDALVRATLGRSASDPDAVAMTSAMLQPAVFGHLRARGSSTARAAELITDVLCAWLEPGERTLRR